MKSNEKCKGAYSQMPGAGRWLRAILGSGCAAVLLSWPECLLAGVGDVLDRSFARKPGAAFLHASGDTSVSGATVQADGKILIAGSSQVGSNVNFALVRLLADGSLDASFGEGGVVTTDHGTAASVAVQSDGRIVVAGTSGREGSSDFALIRYLPDGRLDSSFGSGGVVLTDLGGSEHGLALAVQSDGRILVAGRVNFETGGSEDFAVARYRSDGSLDPAFNGSGTNVVDMGAVNGAVRSIALQADGRIVLAGDSGLARLRSDGTLDPSFHGTGKVASDSGILRVTLLADGKILAVGGQRVSRYLANGSADPGFQGVRLDLPIALTAEGAAVQSDGSILLAGPYYDRGFRTPALVRFRADGTLDDGFGDNGVVIASDAPVEFDPSGDRGTALVVTGDGRILVAATSAGGTGKVAAAFRRLPDGSADPTFLGDGLGWMFVDFAVFDLAVQSDGKVLAAGQILRPDGGADFILARYLPGGALDPTFGTGGQAIAALGESASGNRVVVQGDGRILVLTSAWPNGLERRGLARYLSDGTLDPSFNSTGRVELGFLALAVAVQPDGKIAVAGAIEVSSGRDLALARYLADGRVDESFGTGGMVTTNFNTEPNSFSYATSLAIAADGRILTGGSTGRLSYSFACARFLADGALDSTFGSGGRITTQFGMSDDTGRSVAALPDGKVLLGGTAKVSNPVGATQRVTPDFALAGYLADGSLDPTFGSAGKVTTDFQRGNGYEELHALARHSDGKILATGATSSSGGTDLAVARYHSNGRLDASFGRTGRVTVDFSGWVLPEPAVEYGPGLVAQSGGKAVVGGYFQQFTPSEVFVRGYLLRLAPPQVDANADLAALAATGVPLAPWFSPATASYHAEVGSDQTGTTVTAMPAGRGATMRLRLNGSGFVALEPGDDRLRVALREGVNTFEIEVTSGDRTKVRIYTLAITRASTADAALSGLRVRSGVLTPAFESGTTDYTVSVPFDQTELFFTPTTRDPNATLRVDGFPERSGVEISTFHLAPGDNVYSLEVTALDRVTVRTYRLNVRRDRPDRAQLIGMSLSVGALTPAFDPRTLSYTSRVPSGTSSITLAFEQRDLGARVRINGVVLPPGAVSRAIALRPGANPVTIVVVGTDSSSKTYTVHIHRELAPVAGVSVPAAGAQVRVSGAPASLTVRGVARDDAGIAEVLVSLNGSDFIPARLTPGARAADPVPWELAVTPENGLNTLRVKSRDVEGNESIVASRSFTSLLIRPELAGTYSGLALPTEAATHPARQIGLGSITVTATGAFTGSLKLGGSAAPIRFGGTFGNAGEARFTAAPTPRPTLAIHRRDLPVLELALRLDVSATSHAISGSLTENGAVVSAPLLHRLLYTAGRNPVSPWRNVSAEIRDAATNNGAYTAILDSASIPQGRGWALLRVLPSGVVVLSGRLGDGQAVSCASFLSKDDEWPLYLEPSAGLETVAGRIRFRDAGGDSDADGDGLLWFKPPNARRALYPDGWPAGIEVTLRASKFVFPGLVPLPQRPTLLGNAPATPLVFTASGGGLTGPLSNELSLSVRNVVTLLPSSTGVQRFRLNLAPTGIVSGAWLQTPDRRETVFSGVVLQKTRRAFGHFLRPAGVTAETGLFTIAPR